MEDLLANFELAEHHASRVKNTVESDDPACLSVYEEPKNVAMNAAITGAMDAAGVDALIYPTWNYPARDIGDNDSPAGNNSGMTAPHTGQPAISVPMGYTAAGLPGGLQILGRHFMDQDVFKYAYAYEQATHHRHPPELFGALSLSR
jgi:amidase